MNRYLNYIVLIIFICITISCAKDALWNTEGDLSAEKYSQVVGLLTNDEDNLPLKGIKILVERQTKANGTNTFVDTVSTDAEGNFSYKIPFPNKLRLVIRDTGRYFADTAIVELKEHKDYNVALKSHPRFGVSEINVNVLNDVSQPLEGIKVALFVRGNNTESYAAVDTLSSNAEGKVLFENLAFPVYYKVKIAEREIAYTLDSLEGVISTKSPIDVSLKTKSKIINGSVKLKNKHYFSNRLLKNENFSYQYKSILDDSFGPLTSAQFDENGEFVLENIQMPGEIKVFSNALSTVPFVLTNQSPILISESDVGNVMSLIIKDLTPRYVIPVMTNLQVSTLILNNSLEVTGPQSVTSDNDGNIYIADGSKNQLFKVDVFGNSTIIAGSGSAGAVDGIGTAASFNGLWGVAIDSTGILYTVDAANVSGAHKVRKIQKNPDGEYVVSTLAGTGTAGGANGAISTATFSRPAGIVYDHARKSLYVAEWTGNRVRKIDLITNQVSTLIGTGSTGVIAGDISVARVSYPHALSLSADGNYLYISNYNASAISRYNFTTSMHETLSASNQNQPRGLFVTADDKLVVSRSSAHQLVVYNNLIANTVNTFTALNTSTSSGYSDGTIAAARFNFPFGIYYDKWSGFWYISDSSNGGGTGKVRVMRSSDID